MGICPTWDNVVATRHSVQVRGHPSDGQVTGYPRVRRASAGRRAGPEFDPGGGDGRGVGVGRAVGADRPAGCADRADQDPAAGFSGGQLLVGMAAARLGGEDFLVGLDRQRVDVAGQHLAPAAGLSSTTAAGLAKRFSAGQWAAVETALGDVHSAMLDMLPAARTDQLTESVTIRSGHQRRRGLWPAQTGGRLQLRWSTLWTPACGDLGRGRFRAGRGLAGR